MEPIKFDIYQTPTDENDFVTVCVLYDGKILVIQYCLANPYRNAFDLPVAKTHGHPVFTTVVEILAGFVPHDGLTKEIIRRHFESILQTISASKVCLPNGSASYFIYIELNSRGIFGGQKTVNFPIDLRATFPKPIGRTWMTISEIENIPEFHNIIRFKSTIQMAQKEWPSLNFK